MSWVEAAKRRAAERAVEHVESGAVVGLGSGSTAAHAIRIIGARIRSGELDDILGVPTSLQAAAEAVSAGVPLTTLDEHPVLDLAIDGADQIDGELNAIKGGGGALLREKVVAAASKLYIIIADGTKLAARLGEGCRLPVEVLPFALVPVLQRIEGLGAEAAVRSGSGKLGPVVTENGNLIIDADFGAIADPARLEAQLKAIPGVIETGLFLGYADLAYLGTEEGVRRLARRRRKAI
ncbi:ribose 5-phosphate isomerase A [Candidatus Bathyarchaeota archaeon]|nr:MAG: ribose 5-phosphate isomerase A [Candidatus Bathyarchaeota archaeon]